MRSLAALFIIGMLLSCNRNTDSRFISTDVHIPGKTELENRKKLSLSPMEYPSWVNDKQNGLNREMDFDRIIYNLKSKPIEYIVCNELRNQTISKRQFDSISAEVSGMQYFDMKISIKDFSDEFLKYRSDIGMNYRERVNYCSFLLQDDFKMVVDADTFSCVLFHFERAFDIVPYGVFLLGFPKAPENKDFTIVLRDNLFNNGILKYTFRHELFNYLPKLECI